VVTQTQDKNIFEVVEVFEVEGRRRYRVKLSGTNFVFNVPGETHEEAVKKAAELAMKLGLIT